MSQKCDLGPGGLPTSQSPRQAGGPGRRRERVWGSSCRAGEEGCLQRDFRGCGFGLRRESLPCLRVRRRPPKRRLCSQAWGLQPRILPSDAAVCVARRGGGDQGDAAFQRSPCRLRTRYGSEGRGQTPHEAAHNGVIVPIAVELITVATIKRAISIYCMPNQSQVLPRAFGVGLLHNGHAEVGAKPPVYGRRAPTSSSGVGGRRGWTALHGGGAEGLSRALGMDRRTELQPWEGRRGGQGPSGVPRQRKNRGGLPASRLGQPASKVVPQPPETPVLCPSPLSVVSRDQWNMEEMTACDS